MGNEIEKLSVGLVDLYNVDKSMARSRCNLLIKKLLYDNDLGDNPWIYIKFNNHYIILKALMYSLEILDKSDKIYNRIVLIAYYFLLKIINKHNNEDSCREIAAASGLACILLYNNSDFIGGNIISPLCNNIDPKIAAKQFLLQIGVFYWNYKFANVHVSLDSQCENEIHTIVNSFPPLQQIPPKEIRNKIQSSVYEDIPRIIEYIECIN